MTRPWRDWLVALVILLVLKEVMLTSGTWRYRLTLSVEDHGTVYTGSSVIEITSLSHKYLPLPLAGTQCSSRVRGEAVAVQIGSKGTLFATLSHDAPPQLVYDMFPRPEGPGGGCTPSGIRYYRSLDEGRRDVPFDRLPLLVRFRDPGDPTTVERVDPHYLEASFGEGVRLIGAQIEMTDDPVTWGIKETLPWLPKYKDKLLDGRTIHTAEAPNQLANSLGMGSFSTED